METLIASIEAFCAEHSLSESQFGILALNDKNFIADIRGGRDLRLSTVERVKVWMAEYRPEAA
jgi:aspartate carbamoyltransferase catalytic subunit